MLTNLLAGPGSLPLTLAVLIVGAAFLYWAFTSAGNDRHIARTNRKLGRAEGYLQCIADNYDLTPKSVSTKGSVSA